MLYHRSRKQKYQVHVCPLGSQRRRLLFHVLELRRDPVIQLARVQTMMNMTRVQTAFRFGVDQTVPGTAL
jgi:hypothetical protein